ncbi:magnesium/cobalt transporter CorA [Rubrivirga litoralis]|uniref:Magnesium transport protein CorA n=1 Tax=Rubrivirga litoralis TaxID=3075598 RepID=A0ABU3BN13_9BACT|nr:magnesium/cobalt transporter CorA [Rubrivirga sp. F394]MDT0630667.1 magnesium/cobalt transporter CorA [Rubrivirga sp. F394]
MARRPPRPPDGRRDWDVGEQIAGRLREAGREAGQLLAPLTPRVPRLVERRSHALGRAPGLLVVPEAPVRPARVTAFHYTEGGVEEHDGLSAEAARALADRPGVTWVDVVGVADVATVDAVGRAFGLHPLVVEDLVHTTQRPKIETYDETLFVVARMVQATDADPEAAYATAGEDAPGHLIEQVSLVLGPGWVLSFQEAEGDVFDAVRDRLRRGVGRIRASGADYLLYALLDLVVDHVFVTLERMGDATERLEAQALDDPDPAVQAAISALRREVVVLRRSVWPLREVLARLQDEDVLFVEDRTRPYLRDAADHLVQAIEIIESLREVLASTNDLYLSALGTRQNEVMKVLTVVGTIFLPLGFLTGLYGMNFDDIPELHWRYGYFALLGVMALVTVGALAYFRKNDWI